MFSSSLNLGHQLKRDNFFVEGKNVTLKDYEKIKYTPCFDNKCKGLKKTIMSLSKDYGFGCILILKEGAPNKVCSMQLNRRRKNNYQKIIYEAFQEIYIFDKLQVDFIPVLPHTTEVHEGLMCQEAISRYAIRVLFSIGLSSLTSIVWHGQAPYLMPRPYQEILKYPNPHSLAKGFPELILGVYPNWSKIETSSRTIRRLRIYLEENLYYRPKFQAYPICCQDSKSNIFLFNYEMPSEDFHAQIKKFQANEDEGYDDYEDESFSDNESNEELVVEIQKQALDVDEEGNMRKFVKIRLNKEQGMKELERDLKETYYKGKNIKLQHQWVYNHEEQLILCKKIHLYAILISYINRKSLLPFKRINSRSISRFKQANIKFP